MRYFLYLSLALPTLSLFCFSSIHCAESHESPRNQYDSDKHEWQSLFDGKTLDGWQVHCTAKDKQKVYWKVDKGSILCDSIGRKNHDYVWLTSVKEYGDFELKLKFQAYRDSPGNSGVQVRSRYDTSADAPRGGWLDGPQVDIHPAGPWRCGYLYDETRGEQRWVSPSLKNWKMDKRPTPPGWSFKYADQGDGWNDLFIQCQGTRIITKLNGVTISDFNGQGVLDNEHHRKRNVGLDGHIALQLHAGDALRIRFKDIYIRTK